MLGHISNIRCEDMNYSQPKIMIAVWPNGWRFTGCVPVDTFYPKRYQCNNRQLSDAEGQIWGSRWLGRYANN
jgi:hypothetical protein